MGNTAKRPTDSSSRDRCAREGARVRPIYGERRPMMYQLFQTEMESISAFNSEALRWFSIGSLGLNSVIAIVIANAFSTSPLSELGVFALHYVAPFLGVGSIASFGFGTWAIYMKKGMIDQIKKETTTQDPPGSHEVSN